MSLESEILADSPIAYYKLDETSGTTANDSSGNALHGTYNGTPALNQFIELRTGVTFSGDDNITIPVSALYDNIAACTIEAQVYGPATSAMGIVNISRASEVNQLLLAIGAPLGGQRCIGGRYNDGGGLGSNRTEYTANDVVDASGWVHIVVVMGSGADIVIYKNAASQSTTVNNSVPFPGTAIRSTSGIGRIGSFFGDGSKYSGTLAHVAIFPSALSGARITAHYNASLPAVVPPQVKVIRKPLFNQRPFFLMGR